MHTTELHHPKPAEGQIAGSQPSGDPLASPQTEGLAVAPGAEQSAPAADEKDEEILSLRADLTMALGRIDNLHDEIASLGEVIKTKDRIIEAYEAAQAATGQMRRAA